MRLRSLLLVLAAAVVVVFALLNWTEFSRPVPLNLGWRTVSGPLPLVLLGLLALAAFAGLSSGAFRESHHRRLEQEQAEGLQAQRELAERAEASRFIDLRKTLEAHLRETREHDKTAAAEHEQAMIRTQRELRGMLEQMHRAMAMHLGEMEARLDARIDALADVHAPVSHGLPADARRAEPVPPLRTDQPGEVLAARNT